MPRRLLIVVLLGAATQVAAVAPPRPFETKTWQRLLHYDRTLSGGWESAVVGQGFFFAQDGSTDPGAEWEASVAAFRSGKPLSRMKFHPQCAFPARYRFVRDTLGDAAPPAVPCPELDKWVTTMAPESLTLVFASNDPDAPPSMFGHTFFRVNSAKNRRDEASLLDFGMNFAAAIPDDAGLEMGYHGLTGGYEGHFTVAPYYEMVKTYNQIENRDLWEYELALSPDEVTRLLMHAWEIEQNSFLEYYFLKENCSYQLMAMIEVLRPEVELTRRPIVYMVPVDSLRWLGEYPGLVKEVKFRPSLLRKASVAWDGLTHEQRLRQERLVANPETLYDLDVVELDALLARITYKKLDVSVGMSDSEKALLPKALARRAAFPKGASPAVATPAARPEHSHPGNRIALGGGAGSSGSFAELGLRASMHDLLNGEAGYSATNQILLGDLRARFGPPAKGAKRARLESLVLMDLINVGPVSALRAKPSWRVRAAYENARSELCPDCRLLRLDSGMGFTVTTPGNGIAFGLPGIAMELAPRPLGRRAGLELFGGWLAPTNGATKFLLTAKAAAFAIPSNRQSMVLEGDAGLAHAFNPYWDVRVLASRKLERAFGGPGVAYGEARFEVGTYF